MFKVDDSEVQQFESDLDKFAHRALPFATRATLNTLAFTTQKFGREEVRNKMVTRNQFTERSIQVDKATGLNMQSQEAVVGSTEEYMETQEFGGTKRKSGEKGVAIATTYSAGQGMSVQPRTRLPKRPNKLATIRLRHTSLRASSRRQRNLIAVKEAAKSGSKYVYLDLSRRQGIFKVVGGKRRPQVRMVHDMTRNSVRIPKNPWLSPATDRAVKMRDKIYGDALKFQLRKHHILGH